LKIDHLSTRDQKDSLSILVAGHAVVDEIIDAKDQITPRKALGGPISYCSISLRSLGYSPKIVTHVGDDFPIQYADLLRNKAQVDVLDWKSNGYKTTSYRIDRSGEHRRLWLSARCQELSINDFAGFVENSSKVGGLIVNPVANEVSLTVLERISKEFDLVLIDSQGFVRKFSKHTGEVGMRAGLDISSLAGVDYLKADSEELSAWTGTKNKESAIRQISQFADSILLTSGPGRVEIYHQGRLKLSALPFKVEVRDTTGAGDIMIASFAARISETGDLEDSIRFAMSASTLAVRNYGIEKATLSKQEVLDWRSKVQVNRH